MPKKIEIQLTADQMEQLKPLFDWAKKHPMTGAVLGQAWEKGRAAFKFVKPDEMVKIVHRAVEKANDKTIKPA